MINGNNIEQVKKVEHDSIDNKSIGSNEQQELNKSEQENFIKKLKNAGYAVEKCLFELLNENEREMAEMALNSNLLNINE